MTDKRTATPEGCNWPWIAHVLDWYAGNAPPSREAATMTDDQFAELRMLLEQILMELRDSNQNNWRGLEALRGRVK